MGAFAEAALLDKGGNFWWKSANLRGQLLDQDSWRASASHPVALKLLTLDSKATSWPATNASHPVSPHSCRNQLKEHVASCSFKAGCLKSVSVQSMTTQTLTRKLTNDQPTATLQTREAISQESIFQSFQCCSEEAVNCNHILFLFGFSPYQTSWPI